MAETSTRRRRSESRPRTVSEIPTFLTRPVVNRKLQKKKKRRKGVAGERRTVATGAGRLRQAPDTRRPSAGATQLQRGVDTCRLQAGPNRDASRADAEAGARGRRACSLRLAPSRARGHSLPACCWARERAWNGQFGPVVFCFIDFCPGSSSNTVFTLIGT